MSDSYAATTVYKVGMNKCTNIGSKFKLEQQRQQQ